MSELLARACAPPARMSAGYVLDPVGDPPQTGRLQDRVVDGDQQSARAEEDRKRFALHDLRAYYVTRHKAERGALPDLHANPATTARVYDRAKIVRRRGM
ncbi:MULTISPECIES: hypothetical protein [Burkholderia]|uniref:hypothetical protein n=1 Tax=Burkholderia TaxID=32008 RepID=UPI000AC15E1B|nr:MULTISPECIES: hypothetical protein [Burkholderia]